MPNVTLFDLLWVNPNQLPAVVHASLGEATANRNTADTPKGVRAAILFPFLLTPDVMVADLTDPAKPTSENQRVELLLAIEETGWFSKDPLTPADVNRQLKIVRGFHPDKTYHSAPLFGAGDLKSLIKVEKLGDLDAETRYKTDSRFAGLVHTKAVDLYKEHGFAVVYKVSVDVTALAAGFLPADRSIGLAGAARKAKGKRSQDEMVHCGVKTEKLKWGGQYGIAIDDKDVTPHVDPGLPVVAFHPLCVFDRLAYANVAHLSDLHMVSRQQLMARTPAKVIEDPRAANRGIGAMLNVYSRNVRSLFKEFGGDDEVNLIVIGGDFQDHIRNVDFTQDPKTKSVRKIWDRMNMVDGGYDENYGEFMDLLSMYSFVVASYRESRKPVYAVSGNHDCYYHGYGTSPRPLGQRGNEGIPADHNLTFYEAILAFGRSYGAIGNFGSSTAGKVVRGRAKSPFDKDEFLWFHTVYTPWADFCADLPRQRLAGLGWGNDETLLTVNPNLWKRMGGPGFLPLASDAVTDEQLSLLRDHALRDAAKKVILTTHFTFACYKEQLTEMQARDPHWGDDRSVNGRAGDIYYGSEVFGWSDVGTFTMKRQALYKQVIAEKRQLQVILTGHAHRRGLYTVRRADEGWNMYNHVRTGFVDFPTFRDGKPHEFEGYAVPAADQHPPYIIVSDCGGPIPRKNVRGEFNGWGSDRAAGTKITFADDGEIRAIKAIQTGDRPRLCVAVDYFDVMVGPAIARFETSGHRPSDVARLLAGAARRNASLVAPYSLTFEFAAALAAPLYATAITFYLRLPLLECTPDAPDGEKWHRAAFVPDTGGVNSAHTRFHPKTVGDCRAFSLYMAKAQNGLFAEVALASAARSVNDRYDLASPWTFEVSPVTVPLGGGKQAVRLVRHPERREIPDFDDRETYAAYGPAAPKK